MINHRTNLKSRLAVIISLLMAVVALSGALVIRQRIFDAIKLYHYAPPVPIAALAKADGMNAYTTHVFYVNHPQIVGSLTQFRSECPVAKGDIVLGCYHAGEQGIYIYQVSDPALQGVEQVTAAHEVLHAVYARLSSSKRQQLDTELESYYAHGLTDARVKAEVLAYMKTEPGSVDDEMSCTFGTEIANLPPVLNAYYRQFFNNRQIIVGYEQAYQSVFTSRQSQIKADDQILSSQLSTITNLKQMMSVQLTQISRQRALLQQLSTTNQTAYNQSVDGFNAKVAAYNQEVSELQSLVSAYNQLATTRNSLATGLDSLIKELDTRVPAGVSTSSS